MPWHRELLHARNRRFKPRVQGLGFRAEGSVVAGKSRETTQHVIDSGITHPASHALPPPPFGILRIDNFPWPPVSDETLPKAETHGTPVKLQPLELATSILSIWAETQNAV